MTDDRTTSLPAVADGSEPLEIEVKLGVSRPLRVARIVRGFEAHSLAGFVPVGPAHVVTVTDRYLDTAPSGGRLQLAGIRARLRSQGGRVVLGVKRGGLVRQGVTVRVELEGDATRSLDPRFWPPSVARAALVDAAAAEPLIEIAMLRQRRLVRRVGRGSTVVDLSVDRVDALERGRVLARRHELEAELAAGDEAPLAELARTLARLDGITAPAGSKLAFGLAARRAARRHDRPATVDC